VTKVKVFSGVVRKKSKVWNSRLPCSSVGYLMPFLSVNERKSDCLLANEQKQMNSVVARSNVSKDDPHNQGCVSVVGAAW